MNAAIIEIASEPKLHAYPQSGMPKPSAEKVIKDIRRATRKQYGIGTRLLFHWKQELEPTVMTEPTFRPITVADPPGGAAADGPDVSSVVPQSMSTTAPVIVERSTPGIEVELVGGRRVRFERDTDPETVRPVSASRQ